MPESGSKNFSGIPSESAGREGQFDTQHVDEKSKKKFSKNRSKKNFGSKKIFFKAIILKGGPMPIHHKILTPKVKRGQKVVFPENKPRHDHRQD